MRAIRPILQLKTTNENSNDIHIFQFIVLFVFYIIWIKYE